MSARAHLAAATAIAAVFVCTSASAEDCPKIRPTDPGGYLGYVYESPASSFASSEGNARVWYTTTGPHAPPLKSSRSDGVPDAVVTVATVLEEAIAGYKKLGFKEAMRDGDYPTCASNGGDDRYDVYLVAFSGGDGATATERCTTASPTVRCPGFMLVEKNFVGRGYKTVLEGAQTVVAHEYFHMVQNAYDSKLDRFWAEGTAQWAVKQIYPSIVDLERFLPEFFSQVERPIDGAVGGVTAGFLYGAAIWPVFLSERHGQGIVLDIFDAEGAGKGSAMDSAEVALAAKKSSVGDEFVLFSAWNAATGSRAGTGGYGKAAAYPEVKMANEFPDGVPAQVDAITAGFSARYYLARDPSPRKITLTADEARLSGMAVPLEGGKARIDQAKVLPTVVTGDAILVLGGRSWKKTDGPFTLAAEAPAAESDAGTDAGPPAATPGEGGKSGCSCTMPASEPFVVPSWLLACLAPLVVAVRRRRTNRAD